MSEVRMKLAWSLAELGRVSTLANKHASFLRTSDIITHSFILRLTVNPNIIYDAWLYTCRALKAQLAKRRL